MLHIIQDRIPTILHTILIHIAQITFGTTMVMGFGFELDRPSGEIGRHARFRILCRFRRAGSSPALATMPDWAGEPDQINAPRFFENEVRGQEGDLAQSAYG